MVGVSKRNGEGRVLEVSLRKLLENNPTSPGTGQLQCRSQNSKRTDPACSSTPAQWMSDKKDAILIAHHSPHSSNAR
ncbi:hypothetical protein CGCVW01_v001686 [Colletotrichum viniferum]|nr:hypothetical protein CGCVW01_v001686 [Colletotrichum viniferum]